MQKMLNNKRSQKYLVTQISFLIAMIGLIALSGVNPNRCSASETFNLIEIERDRILNKAESYMGIPPSTVTDFHCPRSEGGPHDFYSEGDYWWPNPEDPYGKYIRRDGETNPDNFVEHRHALVNLSDIIGTLASAHIITNDEKYVTHAVRHLKAWFVDKETSMNPSLLYGQAIKGRYTGRSIGIIDTIHLTEVARGTKILSQSDAFEKEDYEAVKGWFRKYLDWINTHEYGLKEKVHPNNHGVCWAMQAAAFADLVGDEEILNWIRNQFKEVYLAEMMDNVGGFPAELARTKPYGYSLFVIDAMAGIAQIASTEDDNLWTYQLPDGRSMGLGMEFIVPFIKDKSKWPYSPDIMYWDDWPVRHPSLLFAGIHFNSADYLSTWKSFESDPTVFEVLRNLPIRHPLIWTDGKAHANESFGQSLKENWLFVEGDLGGIWEVVRPSREGRPERVPLWTAVTLPHCFNALDAVDPDKNYYQGPGWYKNEISISNPYQNGRVLLHFEGAGQKSEVYVYTTKVGEHVGGYDEWTVDITDAVSNFIESDDAERFKGKVPIAVRCDNSRDLEMIPSDLSDFNLYGGLYREVNLKYVPRTYLDQIQLNSRVDASGSKGVLEVNVSIAEGSSSNEALNINLRIEDPYGNIVTKKSYEISQPTGMVKLDEISIDNPELWSPLEPRLYLCSVTLTSTKGNHSLSHQIGFRNVEWVKHGPFKLNGERLLLKGTHRHEDHAGLGAAMTDSLLRQEFLMMKEMGVNFIRLGHYQQSTKVLELCDELGLLVWEEIPWCRGGLGGEKYKQQAREMLKNMIAQHRNHPSVIIWGLGNENDWPNDFKSFDEGEIRDFMKELHDLSHELDPSRMTAIRRCNFCKDIIDIYSPSIWAGWYRGKFTDYKSVSKKEMKQVDHFLHVEWGASNHARRHSEDPDKGIEKVASGQGVDERAGDASMIGGKARVSKDGDWTETYACNLIDWHLKEQENMPWLTGTAYWPFKDFSTPVRPENPVPYVNQKGVIERDFTKKEAYYVFQSYWTEQPMVHIYGHSWPVRWGNKDESRLVKVYSNCPEVELFLNGKSLGKRKRDSQDFPAAGLRWGVQFLEGENTLKAIGYSESGESSDEINLEYQTKEWKKPTQLDFKIIQEDKDQATVQVYALDANGIRCLDAKQFVEFDLTGDGTLIDNLGTSRASRKVQLYNGRAQISLHKNGGDSVISVSSTGLETKFLTLRD